MFPPDVSSVRVFRIMIAAVRLSGIAVAGKAVRNPRMKRRRFMFRYADRAVSRAP
jgi:hypothetical protein